MRDDRRPVLVVAGLAAALLSGCVHAPSTPRALKPREPVVLELVSFEAPAEDGWTIVDVADPSRRIVNLTHVAADGTWDRRAWVEEWVTKAPAPAPERFLDVARRRLPATDARAVVTPAPAEAMALAGRFGPLSASGAVRSEPTPENAATTLRGAIRVREWIPSAPAGRFVRVGWVEQADATGAVAEAPWRELDASLRSPPPPAARLSTPDVDVRAWGAMGLGVGVGTLRHERLQGFQLRYDIGAAEFFPRAGGMRGLELIGVSMFAGANERWLGLVSTIGPRWWAGRGRLRWGAGAEIGYAQLYDLDKARKGHTIGGFVLGAQAAAQLDLLRVHRGGQHSEVYLELGGRAATPWIFQAGASLGVRFGAGRG